MYEKSFEMGRFRVSTYSEEAELAPSWVAGVAREGNNKRTASTEAIGGTIEGGRDAKTEILAEKCLFCGHPSKSTDCQNYWTSILNSTESAVYSGMPFFSGLNLRRRILGNPVSRLQAVKALAEARNPEGIRALVEALVDPVAEVRRSASEALERIDLKWTQSPSARAATPALVRVLSPWGKHKLECQEAARDALGKMGFAPGQLVAWTVAMMVWQRGLTIFSGEPELARRFCGVIMKALMGGGSSINLGPLLDAAVDGSLAKDLPPKVVKVFLNTPLASMRDAPRLVIEDASRAGVACQDLADALRFVVDEVMQD